MLKLTLWGPPARRPVARRQTVEINPWGPPRGNGVSGLFVSVVVWHDQRGAGDRRKENEQWGYPVDIVSVGFYVNSVFVRVVLRISPVAHEVSDNPVT